MNRHPTKKTYQIQNTFILIIAYEKWKLPNMASIFTIEDIAVILLCLDYIPSQDYPKSVIFSESQNVLHSIASKNPANIKNTLGFLIRNRLFTLSKLN